jgi:hypothetical protein
MSDLQPVPELCQHVCPDHHRACSLLVATAEARINEHEMVGPNWHVCRGTPQSHGFYSTTDQHGNTNTEGN